MVTAGNHIERALDNDALRVIIGLSIAILGSWAFAEIFRAWAYADHWAEPLVIAFCFFVLGWTPIIGFGLIFGYQKTDDPGASQIADEVADILKAAGWTGKTEGERIIITSPDGRRADLGVRSRNAE